MQDGRGQSPAIPVDVLEPPVEAALGPSLSDWRVAQLALTGAGGEEGWVALRVDPFEVLPLVDDCETAEVMAAARAGREHVAAWTWDAVAGWRKLPLPL